MATLNTKEALSLSHVKHVCSSSSNDAIEKKSTVMKLFQLLSF